MPRKLDPRPIYYVYILFDWMGIPRYVGKGKGDRIDEHERRSSRLKAKLTFEERSNISKKIQASMTPAERSAAGRRGAAKRNQSDNARRGWIKRKASAII